MIPFTIYLKLLAWISAAIYLKIVQSIEETSIAYNFFFELAIDAEWPSLWLFVDVVYLHRHQYLYCIVYISAFNYSEGYNSTKIVEIIESKEQFVLLLLEFQTFLINILTN